MESEITIAYSLLLLKEFIYLKFIIIIVDNFSSLDVIEFYFFGCY